jgi:hypothetical protein
VQSPEDPGFVGRFAVDGERNIFGGSPGDRGFALTVVRQGKESEDEKSEAHASPSQEFPHERIHIKL